MNRPFKWLGLVAIGFGGTNSVLLIIDTLIGSHGTIVIPLLAFAFLLSLAAMPGYAELTLMYPQKSGGIAAVCVDAYRPYNTVLANIAGTCYWFAWTPVVSFSASFIATTLQYYYFPSLSVPLVSTLIILGMTGLALCGAHIVQRFAIPIAAATTLLILLTLILPIFSQPTHWAETIHYHIKSSFSGFFGQFTSIMSALYLVGWIAPSIENIFCYVGETEEPEKNVPKAMYIMMVIAFIYFIILPTLWLSLVGTKVLSSNFQDFAAQYKILGQAGIFLGSAFVIFNMILSLIAALMGPPRTLAQLSKDSLIPKFFELESKKNVPWLATLLTSLCAIIIIWYNSPIWLIAASNFGYLISISFASIAVWLLRKQAPQAKRLYRAPKGFIGLSLFSALLWISTIIFGFQQYGITIMVLGIGLSFFGVFLFIARYLADRYNQGVAIIPKSLHLKLTTAIVAVLIVDACVFLLAIGLIDQNNLFLLTILKDMFIFISFLNLIIGIVVPSIVIYAINEINKAAKRLLKGPINDFSIALQQISAGNLEASSMKSIVSLILIYSQDEIGEMAKNFNQMQIAIKKATETIDTVRRSLITEKRRLIEQNLAINAANSDLEQQVRELKTALSLANQKLAEKKGE